MSVDTRLVLFTFLVLGMFLSTTIPLPSAGSGYFAIYSGFYLYPTSSGRISFGTTTRVGTWSLVGETLRLTSATSGSTVQSEVRFKCSDNSQLSILSIDSNIVQFSVTATAGQTSTTTVQLPLHTAPHNIKIDGATSWSRVGTTFTILVTHTSSQTVSMYTSTTPFDTLRDMWGVLVMLIILMHIFAFLSAVGRGENYPILLYILSLMGSTAVLLILLGVVDRLW